MVGDSVRQDVDGALSAGMRAVLLHRATAPIPRNDELAARGVPVMRALTEVPFVVDRSPASAREVRREPAKRYSISASLLLVRRCRACVPASPSS